MGDVTPVRWKKVVREVSRNPRDFKPGYVELVQQVVDSEERLLQCRKLLAKNQRALEREEKRYFETRAWKRAFM